MTKRKAHVKRIFKKDAEGNIQEDLYIDVLRIDMLPISFRSYIDGREGMIVNYRLNWDDKIEENANKSRKTKILKVKTSPDNPDDEAQMIDLWLIERAKVLMRAKDSGIDNQGVQFVFNNKAQSDGDGNRASRDTTIIKVVSNDLDGLELKVNEDGESQLIDWDDYKLALHRGKKDDGTHLDVEVTDKFKISFGVDESTSLTGQNIKYILGGNKEVENLFERGDPEAVDANGDSSVIRTDPFQTIVNVSAGVAILGVDVSSDASSRLVGSVNGDDWSFSPNTSGAQVLQAAFGDGVWIGISNNGHLLRSEDGAKTWVDEGPSPAGGGGICWGKSPDPKAKTGIFCSFGSFASGNTSGADVLVSTDKGKTWQGGLFGVSDDPDMVGFLEFLTHAGDYFYAGVATAQRFDDNGFTSVEPHGVLYVSKNGTDWTRQDLFTSLDFHSVTADYEGEGLTFNMVGAAYDDKTKSYMVFGKMSADAASVMGATSSSGVSFGGSITVAPGVVNGPDFADVSFEPGFYPAGGAGVFVMPNNKIIYVSESFNVASTEGGPSVGSGGGWEFNSLVQSGPNPRVFCEAVVYSKKSGFVTAAGIFAIDSAINTDTGNIFVSEKGIGWDSVFPQTPNYLALGRVSWIGAKKPEA